MGIAKLYSQSGSGGKINGIIQDYYVYAGEKVSAGDFVEFINGVAGQATEASADTAIYTTNGASYAGVSAVKLDENRVFIAHIVDDANYYLAGIVCTISGAKITVGTDTLINSTKNTGYAISTVLLSNGNVLIAHSLGTNYILASTICTISGTTITAGTSAQLSQFTNTGRVISTCLFPNGKVFIAYSYGSSKYSLYGMVVTINGTTVTKGTENSLQGSDYAGASFSTCLLPNGNIFIPHSLNSSYSLYALVCTVSGTTISTNGGSTQLMTSQYSGSAISTELLPNGTVFVAHSDSTSFLLYGFVCTIDGASITRGTDTLINSSNYAGAKISSELLPSGNVFVAHSRTDSYYLDGVVVAIDGTTVTKGTGAALNTNSYSGNRISPVLLPNGTIFVAHSYSTNYHLYAQIFGIDEANNVPTNNVALKEYETQVRKATTSDIYGVAKTSGEGGDSTGHKDIVSIYTVEQTLASLPVGTLVKDPNSTFLGEPVIWKIADVSHEGYPSNSVTLITERSIAMRAFDAKEPNNSDSGRQANGNNRYSVSNIRQWLNSDAEAGQWYSAQHSADTPPSSDNVYQKDSIAINPYDTNAGFLNGFSQSFKNALLETTLTVAKHTVDGGGSETVTDKMFLASNTEVGLANENNIAEGSKLAIFSDDTSRMAYCTTKAIEDSNYASDPANDTTIWFWWLRTPYISDSARARLINGAGVLGAYYAYGGMYSVRPLCNIPSSTKVIAGEDGIYKLIF